jgi:hypothetical protein
MKIKGFKITNDSRTEQSPFLRISNNGCVADGCNCSPKNYISISDGTTGVNVELSDAEWNKLSKLFKDGNVQIDWTTKGVK